MLNAIKVEMYDVSRLAVFDIFVSFLVLNFSFIFIYYSCWTLLYQRYTWLFSDEQHMRIQVTFRVFCELIANEYFLLQYVLES